MRMGRRDEAVPDTLVEGRVEKWRAASEGHGRTCGRKVLAA